MRYGRQRHLPSDLLQVSERSRLAATLSDSISAVFQTLRQVWEAAWWPSGCVRRRRPASRPDAMRDSRGLMGFGAQFFSRLAQLRRNDHSVLWCKELSKYCRMPGDLETSMRGDVTADAALKLPCSQPRCQGLCAETALVVTSK